MKRHPWWTGGTIRAAAVAGVLGLALAAPAAAQDEGPVSRKLQRQIDVMEQILNQVLVDSPNFLVSGRSAAGGLYLNGYGAVFTFQASLIEKDWDWDFSWGDPKVERKDGKVVITLDEDEGDADEKDWRDEYREWRSEKHSQEARLYERGKTELVDMLVDFGDTVDELGADEWLVVAAFLGSNDYFEDNSIGHLVIRARMGDLEAYAADRITEEELRERIAVEEY